MMGDGKSAASGYGMDVHELINAFHTVSDSEAQPGGPLYEQFCAEIARLDMTGRDAWWSAMKIKADEWTRSDIARGRRLAEWMIALADQVNSPLHRAVGLLALGNAFSIGLGEYRQAVNCYDAAAAIYTAQNRPVEEAQSQIGKIYALSNLGRYDDALADGERARRVLAEHGESLLLARLLVNLAILRGRQGQDAEALSLLDQASSEYSKLGESAEIHRLRVELNRALLLRNLGRFGEANTASQAVLDAHQRAGRVVDAARAKQSLGVSSYLQGRYNEALALLEEARVVFLNDKRQRHAMLVELFLSDCLLQLRRFSDVLEKCRQVRELFSGLGTRFEVGQAILNEASAYTNLGRYNDAHASLDEARSLFEQEGNPAAVAETDLHRAGILLAENRAEEVLSLAKACEEVFTSLELPVKQARACLAGARAALALGQVSLAEEQARRALSAGEALFLPDLTYPSRYTLGLAALRQGRGLEGLAAFEQAIEDLELLRGQMMVEFRAGFVEDKGRLYEDTVELCLSLGQVDRGLEFCERAKSRALLDLLSHRADLSIRALTPDDRPLVDELMRLRAERDLLYRRRIGGEGFGERGGGGELTDASTEDARVMAIEKRITTLWHNLLIRSSNYASQAALWQVRTEPVQPYLPPGALLVEYFAVHDRLVAFLVTPDQTEAVYLPASLSQVQHLMQLFWLNLKSVPRSSPDRRPALEASLRGVFVKLYSLLVAPFASRLEGIQKLIIVPHGPLHYLPFHALYDGQQYLLERVAVSSLPGASILRYCREARPASQGLLAVGHSYGGRLPFTRQEAASISGLWAGSALIEDQATLDAFRATAPHQRVLHLATHGEFRSDNPLFSGLALADGWLTTLDVFGLRLNASLVTLSACETGRSVVGGGDELQGLMRSFLAAGAASLVVTLWTVEDQSTALLMDSFYRALSGGHDKGAALRLAQRELMQSNEAYRHPYFWAPFCLVGDEGKL